MIRVSFLGLVTLEGNPDPPQKRVKGTTRLPRLKVQGLWFRV